MPSALFDFRRIDNLVEPRLPFQRLHQYEAEIGDSQPRRSPISATLSNIWRGYLLTGDNDQLGIRIL